MVCVHAPLVSENLLYAEWVIHSLRCNTVHMQTVRKNIRIEVTQRDLDDVALLRSTPSDSNEEVMRGVLRRALTAVKAQQARSERGYLALASDPEHQEFERAVRRRRRSSVDD